MSSTSCEHWSLPKSLAFLAAIFAIVFATFIPTVVAASPSLGSPIILCGGGELRVIYVDDDGVPVEQDSQPSLKCAMALLSGFVALPLPDGLPQVERVIYEMDVPLFGSVSYRLPPVRGPPLRPPSTAPPIA